MANDTAARPRERSKGAEGKALRGVLLSLFRRVIRIYFREVEIVGAPPPETRGRIFGANHVNGIVDPLVVLTSAACDIAPIAKSTLWKVPGLAWLLDVADAVPVARKKDDPSLPVGANDAVFDRVAEHLAAGGNLLIFPEGISHNEPKVGALKTGAGRMLQRAREHGATDLTFQAVALEFDARDVFRSRALVVYGPVRSVEELARGEAPLANAITDQLRDDLTELVVEGDTWAERVLIARVAELLSHDSGDRSLAGWSEIGRQVEAARRALSEGDGVYEDVSRHVGRYYAMLEAARLSDEDLVADHPTRGSWRTLSDGVMLALLPIALAGAVLYYTPYLLPRLATPLAHGERDVVSTYKLGIGLVAFPLWALLLVVLSFVLLPFPSSLAAALLVVASPFAALPWLDRLDRRRGRVRTKLLGEGPSRADLLRSRAEASGAIERAREHLARLLEAS